MSYLFIVGVMVGALAVWWVMRHREPYDVPFGKKEENLRRVLALFDNHDRVTNDDAEHLLRVSNATAERYLDELEKAGSLRQVGRTGRAVYYEKT